MSRGNKNKNEMEAKNLRIGNFVTSKQWGGIHKVEGIEVMKDSWELKVNGYVHKWEEGRYFDLKPIRLTRKWLLKFGFIEIEKPYFKLKINEYDFFRYQLDFAICCYFKSYFKNERSKIEFEEIMYVHELQNLFFAITRQKLELKDKKK